MCSNSHEHTVQNLISWIWLLSIWSSITFSTNLTVSYSSHTQTDSKAKAGWGSPAKSTLKEKPIHDSQKNKLLQKLLLQPLDVSFYTPLVDMSMMWRKASPTAEERWWISIHLGWLHWQSCVNDPETTCQCYDPVVIDAEDTDVCIFRLQPFHIRRINFSSAGACVLKILPIVLYPFMSWLAVMPTAVFLGMARCHSMKKCWSL